MDANQSCRLTQVGLSCGHEHAHADQAVVLAVGSDALIFKRASPSKERKIILTEQLPPRVIRATVRSSLHLTGGGHSSDCTKARVNSSFRQRGNRVAVRSQQITYGSAASRKLFVPGSSTSTPRVAKLMKFCLGPANSALSLGVR